MGDGSAISPTTMAVSIARPAWALIAGALLFATLLARAADPVAFVSDFSGGVELNGAGRPSFLAELLPGSMLALREQSSASVTYVVSGEEYSLKGPGEFIVARQGVKATKGNEPSVRTPALRASARVLIQTSRSATASVRMRSSLPPPDSRPGPLYPVNARIATLQPTLRWVGDSGATHIIVVTNAAGKEVFRGNVKNQSLRLPIALVANQAYSWSLSTGKASERESRFETLPAEVIAVADRARAGARTFTDRVLLALTLQDLGATQDSREIWAQLASERPEIHELAGLSR